MRPYTGPPATLGTTLDAGLDLWGDCQGCRRDVHVDTAQLETLAERYGRGTRYSLATSICRSGR